MILVSPTEPKLLRAVGKSSSLAEQRGADYLIPSAEGLLISVQRKTVEDLLASVFDGRLEREVLLLKRNPSLLIIEGQPSWTTDGFLMSRRRWTLRQHYALILSLQFEHGVAVMQTASMSETAQLLRAMETWASKSKHLSLLRRPTAASASEWGKATDRDFARHLLQGFPGVGVTLADAIIDTFGRVPLAWTVSESDLESVPGIGKRRAESLWRSLEGGSDGAPAGRAQESGEVRKNARQGARRNGASRTHGAGQGSGQVP